MIGISDAMLRKKNMTESRTILVTGGSGFIGTSVCKLLVDAGHNVINIDRKKKEIEGVTQYPFDLDNHQVRGIIKLIRPDSIIHLAADHEVGRSMIDPAVYYANNVANTIALLNNAVEAGVKEFIYSSSSSVYGNTNNLPTPESEPCSPESPYARSKLMVEQILEDYSKSYDFKYISLRYFNAAGAMPDLSHGYNQEPASHLIPILCRTAIDGDKFIVNGNNYNTSDGTAHRDYTHVYDIATAHLAALNYMRDNPNSEVFNIGCGESHSILDVMNAVIEKHTKAIEYDVGPARPGDIAATNADTTKAKELLGWEPQFTLKDIVSHAYDWQKKHKRKKSSA